MAACGKSLEEAKYTSRHGMSYSVYECDYSGVEHPRKCASQRGPVELWDVKSRMTADAKEASACILIWNSPSTRSRWTTKISRSVCMRQAPPVRTVLLNMTFYERVYEFSGSQPALSRMDLSA